MKVIIKCDICGKEKEIEYREHVRQNQLHNFNFDTCRKCGNIKNKITNKEKYGDENYNNLKKCKNTKFEKYGDSGYSNIEKTKKQI
jgi:hypothetical protein